MGENLPGMAGGKRGSSETPAGSADRRRRMTPTIELTATEIPAERDPHVAAASPVEAAPAPQEPLELIRLEADGGSSQSKKIDLKPGKYTFYCSITGHRAAGMVGTLTVK